MENYHRIGLNVIFDKDIYSAIDFASENKFTSIEIWTAPPQFNPERYTKKERAQIVQYSEVKNIQIQVHSLETLSFFEPDSLIRAAYLENWKKDIDFAKDIGAVTITVHPGKIMTFKFPGDNIVSLLSVYPEYFLKAFRENLETLCDYAKGKVDLCMENDNWDPLFLPEFESLLKQNKLFLTWDICKSYLNTGEIKQDEVSFFMKNLNKIRNVHIHDRNKEAGGHQIIGEGFIDFKSLFDNLKSLDINYIIEVRPHENVLKSRDKFLSVVK